MKKPPSDAIQEMFEGIAQSYDRANAVLSFGLHHYWNRTLIQQLLHKKPPRQYLDLCCGTGEISLSYLKKAKMPCQAHLLDFCAGMLSEAKKKAHTLSLPTHELTFHQADAQKIPLESQSIDCTTLAYGIRNVQNTELCLQEIERVLRPGGTLGILELTVPTNKALALGHALYLNYLLPTLGKLVTSKKEAYDYLCASISAFIRPTKLKELLLQVGFTEVRSIPLTGGIATIIVAKKNFNSDSEV